MGNRRFTRPKSHAYLFFRSLLLKTRTSSTPNYSGVFKKRFALAAFFWLKNKSPSTLHHPSYSPDSAPCDFFRKWKRQWNDIVFLIVLIFKVMWPEYWRTFRKTNSRNILNKMYRSLNEFCYQTLYIWEQHFQMLWKIS